MLLPETARACCKETALMQKGVVAETTDIVSIRGFYYCLIYIAAG